MPYRAGQDIGGFGRLAEAQRYVRQQERLDVKESQQTQLFQMQMEANQANLDEVKRGRAFKQSYMTALSQAAPGEHYNAGTKYLNDFARNNPDNADLAYTAMQELDSQQSKVIDDLVDINPRAAATLASNTILKKHGITTEYAGKVEKKNLVEMFTDTGKFLGTYVMGETDAQGNPVLYSENRITDPTGKAATPTDADDYVENLNQAAIEETGRPLTARQKAKARIEYKRASAEEVAGITLAKKKAERDAQLMAARPKARASLRAFERTTDLTNTTIDEALALASPSTTGLAAKATKNVPGTDAFNLREKLKTIQANIAFGYLQEMRANSPTGGAVGQLSERELELMGVTKASLNQDLDDQDLIKNLQRIKQELNDMKTDAMDAYRIDFNTVETEEPQREVPEDIRAILKKYGAE
jgi:hypothetical protein